MRWLPWFTLAVLACGGETPPAGRADEPAAPVTTVSSQPEALAEGDAPEVDLAPVDELLTDEERCGLEGAAPDCLVRLAEEIEAEDPERAHSLREEACFNGSTEACDRLGH